MRPTLPTELSSNRQTRKIVCDSSSQHSPRLEATESSQPDQLWPSTVRPVPRSMLFSKIMVVHKVSKFQGCFHRTEPHETGTKVPEPETWQRKCGKKDEEHTHPQHHRHSIINSLLIGHPFPTVMVAQKNGPPSEVALQVLVHRQSRIVGVETVVWEDEE